MDSFKIISNSEADTMDFAKTLASKLKKGDVVVLTGELVLVKQNLLKAFYLISDYKMKFQALLSLLLMNMIIKIFLFFILMFIV